MNAAYSDPQLLEWTLDLSKKFRIDTFFETGTYHGNTAKVVSNYFKRVISIENNEEYYNIALNTLNNISNCKVYLGSSPDWMEKLIDTTDSIFFFLDAHWGSYLPLLDELKIIKEKKLQPVIAIHDFYVPNNNGGPLFGYDTYNNQPLNFEYIKDSIELIYGSNGYETKYSTSSSIDSGVIYIFPKNKII